MIPTLRSQAHLQVAPANAKTKTCKRACLPQRTADRKDAAKMKDKLTGKINNETLTKAICNKGFSGNSSILPRIKFRVGGQESSPQSLTAYSLKRYGQVKKTERYETNKRSTLIFKASKNWRPEPIKRWRF